MSTEVTAGTFVGGYRVVSLIGSGAMGSVFLAEDTVRGGKVALKVLVPELDRDDRFRRRLLQESKLVASLDHPHIVPTLESGDVEGRLFLAMACVEGSDLRELLRQEGRLEQERALRLLGQVAGTLDAAHAAGLVHRDVKPGNILVTEGPEGEHAYVCDFGLARHVSSVSSLSGDRGFVGTIDYVPPEQIEGGKIDGRADVYSLGCVLYECLAGIRPFDRESELSVVFAHLNEPPPAITELRPELPRPFDDVFAKALAKDPADRYVNCSELVESARTAQRGKVIRRRASSRRRTLVAAAALLVAGGLWAGFSRPRATWIFFGNQNGPTKRATVIVTWNPAFKTARGIGPCSTIADMKKAYGAAVEPDSYATMPSCVFTYDVGNNLLLSAFGPNDKGPISSKTITAVGLFDGAGADAGAFHPYAGFVTGNETPKCAR